MSQNNSTKKTNCLRRSCVIGNNGYFGKHGICCPAELDAVTLVNQARDIAVRDVRHVLNGRGVVEFQSYNKKKKIVLHGSEL